MPHLELLRHDHAGGLLTFERENRAYFAASIPDRGDDFFARFDARLEALLAEQEAGICFFHVVVDDEGDVVGRVNLIDAAAGSAELGYRIAERAAGRGLATASVREVCVLASRTYGLTSLTARTTLDNAGSRAVLTRAGFVVTSEIRLTGRPGLAFVRDRMPQRIACLIRNRDAVSEYLDTVSRTHSTSPTPQASPAP
ncbi:GNAT family N-acetyltransferase [Streptomyces sp. NPDC006530]|uniref:GNAT family N-acetyltransferase n=1 Tax=Streptomyces sp. NPDC006530 TaxID=3364750 RepID=UPI0036C5E58E